MIQDTISSIITLCFCYSVIIQIVYSIKHKSVDLSLYSLIINFVGLYILAVTFLTLNLIFLSITNIFVGTAWLILLILKLKYRSK